MAIKATAQITLSSVIDVKAIYRYYKLQSSNLSAPSKPTTYPPSGWDDAEPTYTSGSTNTLYVVDCNVYSNDTWSYTNVSKSTSYEAAKEAYNKATNAQNTATSANNQITYIINNYGYPFKKDITVYGDPNTYYPVVLSGGNQNIMREILITRSYNELAPAEWNGHPSLYGISLNVKIKCNFGGWGGTTYSWNIHDLEESYGNVFASCLFCMAYMGFAIFLRGGGSTGATYHLYSDQNFNTSVMHGNFPKICYNQDRLGWSGGTEENPDYYWNAPPPRTLTDAVKQEIAGKKYIDVATTDAKIKVESDRVTAIASRMSATEVSVTTLTVKADGLETKINQASSKADNAAKTATNYLNFGTNGLVVGDMTATTLGKNVLIDNDSIDIRNGTNTLASFGANKVILGQNNQDSEIDLCSGAGKIKALTSGASTVYPAYDSIEISSQEISTKSQKFVADVTNVGSSTPTFQNNSEIVVQSNKSTEGSYSRMSSECIITSSKDKYQTGISSAAVDDSINTKTSIYSEFWDQSAGTWAASNHLTVYNDKTVSTKPIVINGTYFTGKNKVLWSGSYYMAADQSITLSEAISAQANGIVIVWSLYKNGAAANQDFNTFFVPKQFITLHNGCGISMLLTTGSLSAIATKYLVILDTAINGNSNNNANVVVKDCGITSSPKNFVLRYVIGV